MTYISELELDENDNITENGLKNMKELSIIFLFNNKKILSDKYKKMMVLL